jgi:hypothetical protein
MAGDFAGSLLAHIKRLKVKRLKGENGPREGTQGERLYQKRPRLKRLFCSSIMRSSHVLAVPA